MMLNIMELQVIKKSIYNLSYLPFYSSILQYGVTTLSTIRFREKNFTLDFSLNLTVPTVLAILLW